MEKTNIAKAGTLLCVDKGSYSDHTVMGFFVVLRDFDPHMELSAYLDINPENRKSYRFEEYQFLAYLLSKGLLLEVQYGNIFLSGNSDYEEFEFTPAQERILD